LSTHPIATHPAPPHDVLAGGAPAEDHVALLGADPSFAAALPDTDVALAERVLHVPRLQLAPGAWAAPDRSRWPAPTSGLLLLEGVVARHVALGDRVATQLLGPGDVLDPWPRTSELVPAVVRWSVHEPATAAVLDGRFATASRRWPGLSGVVHERLAAAAERLATHLAICQLPRVEDRVLALLWHLAERFGRVAPSGVVVPLRLTHRLVGQLAGAQRPTVSLAFAALFDDGRVSRRDDGSLVLAPTSRASLEPAARTVAAAGALTAPVFAQPREPVRVLHGDFGAERERRIAVAARPPADAVPGEAA
jgi:CRP/FNR family cyclic AMP-dependent transcriptional regulator